MLNRLLVINLALVIGHQIDAAYWREWEMFALPGGIALFNGLNVVIFTAVLTCFVLVVQRRRAGFACSLLIAAASGIVLPIHAGFALAGFTQFNTPVSIALIVGTFVVSIAQGFATVRARGEFIQD